MQHRPQQLSDAFTQAAGAGQVLQFPFADFQQVPPGAWAVLWIAQRQAGLVQVQLIAAGSKLDRASKGFPITGGIAWRGKFDADLFHRHWLACQAA